MHHRVRVEQESSGRSHRTSRSRRARRAEPASARLLRGNALDVLRSLPTASIDAIVTDAPYGIGYRSTRGERILGDRSPEIWWMGEAFRVLRRRSPVVCFCRWDVSETFRTALEAAGFRIRCPLVWNKARGSIGDCRRTLAPAHEIAWIATKGDWRLPGRRIPDVLTYPRVPPSRRCHPTEKPVGLLREILACVTREGDLVLDPFAGSGSTGEASIREGRRFLGVELDPRHAATARRRLGSARRAVSGFSPDDSA